MKIGVSIKWICYYIRVYFFVVHPFVCQPNLYLINGDQSISTTLVLVDIELKFTIQLTVFPNSWHIFKPQGFRPRRVFVEL